MLRLIIGVEIMFIFNIIMFQIWIARDISWILMGLIGVIVVGSWLLHRDSPHTIGLYPFLPPRAFRFFSVIAGIVGMTIAVGMMYGSQFNIPDSASVIASDIGIYFLWAFAQQVALNSFLANRLFKLTRHAILAILISAFLFSIVHAPNLFVVVLTFFGGMASSWYFLKYRNIYVLAFAHAITVITMSYFLPVDWHHHFIIGPRFFE